MNNPELRIAHDRQRRSGIEGTNRCLAWALNISFHDVDTIAMRLKKLARICGGEMIGSAITKA